jgi:hypothetical protein
MEQLTQAVEADPTFVLVAILLVAALVDQGLSLLVTLVLSVAQAEQ